MTFKVPKIIAGEWQGEIAGTYRVNYGQSVQPGPPKLAVEFSYVMLPSLLRMKDAKFTWPSVTSIFAPTPMKPSDDEAGFLMLAPGMPSLTVSLNVTREQFSDIVRALENGRLRHFRFRTTDEVEGAWPLDSWDFSMEIPEGGLTKPG